ncbi:uncharacterized protein LOC124110407 isoform X2 [Haliotis rufescens]|uniref:uncharacterized protein LOC124110407 isoform X2 n=1 Tax=Haliotis rufescens TaxID=6454 RepID=UPI00201F2290|nr:uncharacterized protein LOC124110407 isoform X2 [Haliotis rufescens]
MRIWQLPIVLGLFHLGKASTKLDCSRRKLDLVFLLDSSGSVKLHNFKTTLSFVKSFLSTTSIDDGNVRVGVVTFNHRAHIQFHLNQYKTKKELFRAIDKIKYKKGATNTYAGLRTLRTKMFSKRRGDRRGAKNVALVITDGLSNRNAKKTIPEAKAVRKANIQIYAIGIGLKKRTAELEGIASRPIEENRFTVKDFKRLGGLKEKVFASVCQFATTPLPPKDCSRRKLDLVFLLDSSGSVKLHNFKTTLSFVKSFLSTTSIDDGNVRVGVVTFNHRAHIQFHLNQYKTKKELFRAIDKIKYKKGATNTYAGLRTLRTKMFSKRRGDRRGAKNVALVITDGLSNRNAKKTIPEAKAVRKANIQIYAIGIGLKKRTAELEGIASRPIEENRFTVKDFKRLGGLKEKVFASVCQFATTPLPPKDCSRRKLDLVFLLDSSGSVKLHNFKTTLSFVKSFLSTTSIDDGNVRVGVVTFNHRAHIQFHLNQYKTKKELFRAIDKIKYKKGATNTYAGLRTLRTKMFSKRRGDRRGAKNVALVITDGLSNRNAKKTIPEAKAVRKANIQIYAIGIGLKKRTAELEGIASRPIEENRFTVKDFKRLGGLKEKVFASVCQFATTPLPPKDCSRRKLDLVFLLDSSGSVKLHNFKTTLSFVKSFLSTTSIDDGNVRVGVVTFNHRAHIQFHLNQYKTKKELFRAIDKIKYKKGATNTYAGLRTLRTKMFSKRRGDRRGAKNVALVITDGLSNRNAKKTIPEAKAVRKANIQIYAIGIGLKKRTAELEGIASRPIEENRFTVKDFKRLGGLKEKVFASVCQFATTPLPPKDCSRRKLDLVFLLDSSGSVKLHNFKTTLSFVKSFLSTTSIDDGNVRVGVVTFNHRAHIQFHLNQYKTKKELFRAIDKIKYKKGATNTYAGLRTLRTKMFSKRRGDRRGAKNVALVITDGLSNRNAKKTIPEAKAVRKANIQIYAIGIGLKKRTAELEGIASRPIEENRFTVKDFKRLGGLKEKVFASVCQFATTPLPPKDCSRRKLDLVFLLDSSGSVKLHNFKTTLSFVKSFLSTTSIDDGNVRVGVVTFNHRAHIQFHLNQYKTKKELFRAIDKIKYKKGATNTYAGLRTLRTKMFSKRRGDRRGAKNVALVITDGLSNRNAKKTIPEAKAVRKANIQIYAIGIGLKKRTAELEGIASRPIEENRFTVKDFKRLGGLKEKVFASVCQFATTPLPPKDCSRRKLDLVFLLDSSGSVKLHNFKTTLSFVKSFLSTTSIDDGNVRVGVVTFNHRAHIQFHLNQYKTKKELFRAIDKIKYKKGATNTYAGLRTLRTKMFSKRRGDRRGAKNVALVITDGLSNRNAKKTIPEAKAVRKANIQIYAIGIGLKKRTAELEGIASRPIEENRFTVKDFKRLGGLKEKVFASVCQFATTPLPPKGRCHKRRCRNGGTCKQIGPLKWKCLCRRGFRGRRCRRKVGVGRCHKRRCRNGGTCKQIGPLKWKCLCRRGFRGRRCRRKVGVGRCHKRRCRNGGTCKQIGPLKWKCLCRRGFRGRRCRRKVGVGRCHKRRCRNGGTCKQIGPLKWKCLCRRGFRGRRCRRKVGVGRCHKRRCRNGGTCKQIGPLKWKCLCRRGFRGRRCRRKVGVGRCHKRRCRNGGTCKQIGPLKWKCLCRRGFRGRRCRRKVGVGRCHKRRCRNGGTCKQIGPLKWKCLCRRGFRGRRCRRKVGVGRCHKRRCRNGGTCKQIGPLKWKCLCRRGFRGRRCRRKVGVGRCHKRRCRNGGTCKQIGPLKWKCLCRRGFRGRRCRRKVGVGRCHKRRCRNGGTCKQIGPLKWKCLCRRGFRGRRCRRKVGVGRCHKRRCRNGGTCKQIGPLKWKCLCRRGFRGRRCRRKVGVGRCHKRRCRNGGTCKQIGPLKWKCLCRRGFRGRRCRRKVGVGRCHKRRCRNGGTCKQIGPLKWKCLCRRGFRGRRCRRKVGVGRCHKRRCRNGGTCKQIGPLKWKCLCRRGFRGRRCRRKVGVGRCHKRRCRNGGTCKQIGPLKWKCLCRRGFRGRRCRRKVGVGRCHKRRCRNGGTCKQIGPLKWKCLCRRGFRGRRCRRKVGVGRCHKRRCRNGGTCKQIGPLKWKCLCRRGFRGRRCRRKVGVGRCHKRRCRNGGTCKQIGPLKWKCLCRRGFRGRRCRRKVGVGRCHKRRCRNGGTCKQIGPLKWKCLCRRGFRGRRCRRKVGVGRCHKRRCRNGGTCKQIGPLKWKCLCRRGFRGRRCRRKVGVGRCHKRRCRNGGTCKQIGPLKWKCLCRRGFRGRRCRRKVGVGRCHKRRCRNGGTCKQIGPLKWKCLCRRGFRGRRCRRKVGVGRCHKRRCRNGGTCKQIGPLKWKCLCRRGFRGRRCRRKVGVGRCHKRRCRNGGTCKQIGPLKWKCLCRRGFRGRRCRRKVGVGRCHKRRCRNGGTCKQIGPLKWKCLCRRGFRGRRCRRKVGVGRCHKRRCRNGGTCKQIGPLKWKCLCRRGFRGRRCRRKVGVGRCHKRRCRNGGTCKQIGPLKWKCLCRRGFRGRRCRRKVGVGRCHKRRCRNGGTCKQIGPLKWKCLCRRGFRGRRCRRKVGVGRCHKRRCRNGGTCKQIGPLKWKCLCRRGFRGRRCRRKVGVGRCHKRRCRNGGTCKQIGPLKWKCLCRRGFRGRRCRRKVGVGRCHKRRCRNGGTCKQIGPLKWKCLCRRGFRGRRCRRKVGVGRCHKRRCRNGGTCKQIGPLKWKCLCRRGFRGRRCRRKVGVGRCHKRRCRNGGTCKQIGPLKWKCLCRRGFRGRRCRRKVGVGRCHKRRCRNGGTCKQIGPLKWKCLCRRGFRGRRCRRKVGVVCSQRKLDILVVEDASNSIGKLQYSSLKRFEQQMLRSFEISSKAINVAFMVFSVNARVVFQLNAYSNNKPAVLAAVNAQANEGGASSHIGEAIKLANADVFTSRNGDRPDADNMVIFFTDADGTCDDKLVVAANIGYLQAKSEVFVVHTKGLGDTANRNVTISALASDPDNKHAFHVDNSNAVTAIMQRVEACRAQ